ncbi:SUKH-4 family immunity protein [Actinomadura macrotermitis]|uniref:SUKH-4 immunity protein n=1 Tax=Actinomadura macrotermitis TaxID=2585200 RepID=A0A7K0BXN6_9ACTN|nr:SUKH-4 family immunity protein [Actinomadura macrotermitis]MQY05846.1 hypothetical protein [Actinomadura macrotermitis]
MRERLTRRQLIDVFGEDNVVRGTPAGITHPFTRRFLAEVGVPVTGRAEFVQFAEGFPDELTPLTEPVPPALADAWYIGDAFGAVFVTIALDGETGTVHAVPEGHEEPYLMNTDIESLVFFLTTLERRHEQFSAELVEDGEAFAEAARTIEREWRAHDPAPFAVPEGEVMRVWPNLLDDIECGTIG